MKSGLFLVERDSTVFCEAQSSAHGALPCVMRAFITTRGLHP